MVECEIRLTQVSKLPFLPHPESKKEREMDREQAIQQIEGLYPTDSQYTETNKIGERLLAQAKREVIGWQNEPTEVLIRYAELCIAEEAKQDRHYFANRHGHY